ncbi:glycoside hydrolase family 61 protein [Morchella conica CCBAS932]|uniref:AA9 family lytic polysaccharide monooxygenase n=1 Tax=Morchella conica CCBAS932 TaxID=1392247 RepID=A0A3N4LA71_9PEZI|nr:glycoside hydrolase family 61 protein [Morchella conica CCBAS932]
MKITALASLMTAGLLATGAHAHTRVYGVWVNGVFQGDGRGVYVRSPPNNNPVKDITSSAINCNVAGTSAVGSSVTVATGATFEFEWYHDVRSDDIIAASHKGPVQVYIAPASSNGNGAVWTKIASEGLSGGVWAVDKLIANKGRHSVTIPSWLKAGDYLIRAEIIGLHESEVAYSANSARGAQFYPSCTQIKVTGSGTTSPSQNYAIQGGYSYSDEGIVFNLYFNPSGTYTAPGPAVWSPGAAKKARSFEA